MKTADDGLEALRAELSLEQIIVLIERTARWVSPETFALLPLWYPEHSRRGLFFKANWSEPQLNRNRQTQESVHKKGYSDFGVEMHFNTNRPGSADHG